MIHGEHGFVTFARSLTAVCACRARPGAGWRRALPEALRRVPRPGRRTHAAAGGAAGDDGDAHHAHARFRRHDDDRLCAAARRARGRRGLLGKPGGEPGPRPQASAPIAASSSARDGGLVEWMESRRETTRASRPACAPA